MTKKENILLNKNNAIEILNKKLLLNIKHSELVFCNICSSKPEWWFHVSNKKFNSNLHLLLNNYKKRILYHFFIKSGSIKNPYVLFYQDSGKNDESNMHIPVGDEYFTDRKEKYQFIKYLNMEIKY